MYLVYNLIDPSYQVYTVARIIFNSDQHYASSVPGKITDGRICFAKKFLALSNLELKYCLLDIIILIYLSKTSFQSYIKNKITSKEYM